MAAGMGKRRSFAVGKRNSKSFCTCRASEGLTARRSQAGVEDIVAGTRAWSSTIRDQRYRQAGSGWPPGIAPSIELTTCVIHHPSIATSTFFFDRPLPPAEAHSTLAALLHPGGSAGGDHEHQGYRAMFGRRARSNAKPSQP